MPVGLARLAMQMLLVLCVTLAGSHLQVTWPPPTWTGFEATFRDTQLGAAMIGACCGAWCVRRFDASSLIAPGIACRPAWRTVGRALVLLGVVNVIAYLLGLAPTWIVTSVQATAGRADSLPLIVVMVDVALWPVCGFLTGTVIRSSLAPVFAICVAELIILLPVMASNTIPGFSALSIAPVWNLGFPFVGEISHPGTAWARLVLSVMTGCCMFGAIVALQRQWPSESSGRGRAAVWMAPPALLAAMMLVMQPVLVAPDPGMRAVCQSRTSVTVCVAAAYRRAIVPTMAVAARAARLFPFDGAVTVVGPGMQGWDLHEVPGVSARALLGRRIVLSDTVVDDEAGYLQSVADDLAADLSGVNACSDISSEEDSAVGRYARADRLRRRIVSVLLTRHESPEMSALSAWYAQHRKEISICAVKEEELP